MKEDVGVAVDDASLLLLPLYLSKSGADNVFKGRFGVLLTLSLVFQLGLLFSPSRDQNAHGLEYVFLLIMMMMHDDFFH